MVRQKDEIWKEWSPCGVAADGKQYAECNYYDHPLQLNVTRFKQHTAVICDQAHQQVKNKYRKMVMSQSLASNRQKMYFEASKTENVDVGQDGPKTTSQLSVSSHASSSVSVASDNASDNPVVSDSDVNESVSLGVASEQPGSSDVSPCP